MKRLALHIYNTLTCASIIQSTNSDIKKRRNNGLNTLTLNLSFSSGTIISFTQSIKQKVSTVKIQKVLQANH